ncbi:hypothetical protein [Phyllobacterium leguminum]|uniref:Uncharacterized protein n=1 Tax=Phyllobacterium leguminum TaxID=314237 RepID=A0A318T9T8_9HYPH|nr:hypothetical protein [Phyllobacterium leguminum]PYE87509.1 hypothetical protein C7477_11210 [Phyllobacterium leguminum]
MEDRKISVTLTGPAKIDGVREPAGKTVAVTTTFARQLAASGVIDPVVVRGVANVDLSDTSLEINSQAAFDLAVAQKAKVLAETMVDEVIPAVVGLLKRECDEMKAKHQLEIAKLGNDLAEYRKTIDERDRQLVEMVTHTNELEKKLSDATARAEAAEKKLVEVPQSKPEDEAGKSSKPAKEGK